jgi:hypothetical protein
MTKILPKVLFVLITIILIYLLSLTPVVCLEDYYSLIFTFQSIIIGFTVTSLSIIVSSPFSKKLYKSQSKVNNSETLLHEFLHEILFATIIFIVPLLLILLHIIIKDLNINYIIYGIYNSTIFVFTLLSLAYFIKLIIRIKDFVLQSAKS